MFILLPLIMTNIHVSGSEAYHRQICRTSSKRNANYWRSTSVGSCTAFAAITPASLQAGLNGWALGPSRSVWRRLRRRATSRSYSWTRRSARPSVRARSVGSCRPAGGRRGRCCWRRSADCWSGQRRRARRTPPPGSPTDSRSCLQCEVNNVSIYQLLIF